MFMKNGGHMIHMRGYLEIVTNFLEIVCSQLKEDTCCVYPSNFEYKCSIKGEKL